MRRQAGIFLRSLCVGVWVCGCVGVWVKMCVYKYITLSPAQRGLCWPDRAAAALLLTHIFWGKFLQLRYYLFFKKKNNQRLRYYYPRGVREFFMRHMFWRVLSVMLKKNSLEKQSFMRHIFWRVLSVVPYSEKQNSLEKRIFFYEAHILKSSVCRAEKILWKNKVSWGTYSEKFCL